jgi:hypothetical protein
MFKINKGKGFQITFENGWTVSVQFGHGNYCNNRFVEDATQGGDTKSQDAEIAAWDQHDTWHKFESDKVTGYQSPAQVLAFINMIASKE